jgi:hypothetical protein
VCRLAPALAHNYLHVVDEGSDHSETAFESTFGNIGQIPFLNIEVNNVLPLLTLPIYLVTILFGIFKDSIGKIRPAHPLSHLI